MLEVLFMISIVVVALFVPELTYCRGDITNYSMGVSAYTYYIMAAIYMSATVVVLLAGWKKMGHHR